MSDVAAQPRERVILIDTATNNAPTSSAGGDLTQPHIVLSPRCPGGEPCRGFAATLVAPDMEFGEGETLAAEAAGGGFTLTFWRLNPSVGVWAKCEPYTGALYNDQLVCYDLGGGTALYLQITNVATPGKIQLLIAELP